MNTRDPRFTARLEEALRVLSKQPTRPLAYLTSRFGLESGDLANAELRDAFFEALIDGTGLTKVSPVYHLREKLLGGDVPREGRANARVRRALIVKAWNHVQAGEKVAVLRFDRERDTFPRFENLTLPAAPKRAA